MEFIAELVFDIVFEGVIEAAKSSGVPLPLRILLAAMIVLVFIGVCAIVFIAAWSFRSWILLILALVFLYFACWERLKKHESIATANEKH